MVQWVHVHPSANYKANAEVNPFLSQNFSIPCQTGFHEKTN